MKDKDRFEQYLEATLADKKAEALKVQGEIDALQSILSAYRQIKQTELTAAIA